MTQPTKKIVKKVEGGYQVHSLQAATIDAVQASVPLSDRVYFHPTSAYAAMGRMVHIENIKGLENDPAKMPKASAK